MEIKEPTVIHKMARWKCRQCTHYNQIRNICCEMCRKPRIFPKPRVYPKPYVRKNQSSNQSDMPGKLSNTSESEEDIDECQPARSTCDTESDYISNENENGQTGERKEIEKFDKMGKWLCEQCRYANEADDNCCQACRKPRFPDELKTDETNHSQKQDEQSRRSSDWSCSKCTLINKEACSVCMLCGTPKWYCTVSDTAPHYPLEIETIDITKEWQCTNQSYKRDQQSRRSSGRFDSSDEENNACLNNSRNDTAAIRIADEWQCDLCTHLNGEMDTHCEVCGTSRILSNFQPNDYITEFPRTAEDQNGKFPEMIELENDCKSIICLNKEENGWSCSQCTFINADSVRKCKVCDFPRQVPYSIATENLLAKEIRIIIIGKTGSGKSATANSILMQYAFRSEVAQASVTKTCKRGTAIINNKKLLVVDTPGLFDTGLSNENVTIEILKSVGLTAPGPHAILLIIRIGRFTKEEGEAVELLRKAFGHDMNKYMIVVFTRKDELDREAKSIDNILSTAPHHLRQILSSCNNRYIAWNNNATNEQKESQNIQLFEIIENMVQKNGGEFYHSIIFDTLESLIGDRERQIRREYEDKMRRHLTRLSIECELRLEDMKESEEALRRQLHSLQQQSEKEDKAVQQQLTNLRDEMDQYADSACESDQDNVQRLKILQRKITEVQENLKDVKQQRRHFRDRAEQDSLERERKINDIMSGVNFRDDVRDEIEQGSRHLLARFLDRLKRLGTDIASGFRSIYETLKSKHSQKA